MPPASPEPPPEVALDLDLRGLRCPMPVLRTRRALAGLKADQVLRVTCTDPLAGLDLPHLLRETGDTLVSMTRSEPTLVFVIRKA